MELHYSQAVPARVTVNTDRNNYDGQYTTKKPLFKSASGTGQLQAMKSGMD